MSYVVRSRIHLPKPPAWTVEHPARNMYRARPLDIVTRRYEISWRQPEGGIGCKSSVAPALPVFERAFSAFAQGTLIRTADGPVAVEDLQPGDMIATADGGLQPLEWIGSMTAYPNHAELGLPPCRLFRITDGRYGHDRNAPDLILGSAARILPGHLATDSSSPLHDPATLVDGQSIIAIMPVSQIRVFHLVLRRHSLLHANGVLCESYHPGYRPASQMDEELRVHFAALFPQVESLDTGFGALNHQRAE